MKKAGPIASFLIGVVLLTLVVVPLGCTSKATPNTGLSVSSTSLPNGDLNVTYSKSLAATGGGGTYTWSITSGSLPSGLLLDNSTGAITGTPTAAGPFSFTVQVSDGIGTATQSLSITIQLKVVTTTSLISSIVEQVGGDKVQVANIIPPAQCPGQFDVKPSDVQMLADAKLFLMHGWQGEMFTQQLIQSANNPELKVVAFNIVGNWMTPTVQAQAIGNITSTLAEIDPENAGYYQSNAQSELADITAKGNELEAKLAAGNLSQVNVICDEQVTDLAQWAGFNVVASYPRPDAITPKILEGLIHQGQQSGVALVIGNLQSGTSDAAVPIAEGIGAVQVTLSNFPGGFDDTKTWQKAIDKDVNLLIEAMAKYREANP